MQQFGIGATTGDPSKAVSMALGAGFATGSFTNFYGSKLTGAFSGTRKAAFGSVATGYMGGDKKAIEQYMFDKEFMENPDTIDALTKSLGTRDAALEAIKDGSVQTLLNSGETDASRIGKALKLRNEFMSEKGRHGEKIEDGDQALARAISMNKWNKTMDPMILADMSEEQERFREGMRKKGYSNKRIDDILDDIDYFNT